jgi:hypothetical protein
MVPAQRKRTNGGNGETGTAQKRTPATAKLPASLARTAGNGERNAEDLRK